VPPETQKTPGRLTRSTLSNLTAFKRLQGRIAAMSDASWGSVPVLVA
jgi:hypothetical protein